MQNIQHDPIAIIGIGCRFPGADNPVEYWKLLSEGRNAIREIPATRWNIDALYDPDPAASGKITSRWGGFLDHIDQFDWHAFRLLPREVKHMDPQQRLLLEVAWEALEDAGLPLEQVAGSRTSVCVGIGWNDYFRYLSRNWSQLNTYAAIGNHTGFAANRLSYFFDLKGPSLSVDASCTSSLMSVLQACQSLWSGEAEMALAGGVNITLSPDISVMLSEADFLSHDGQCKTLDSHADGFVRGEGAGIVVLKPLSQVKSSERVYAVIQGIAANHNGHNEWLIASSRPAQEALLQATYCKAGVDPAEIDYVELHGTGFLQGDATEAQALGTILNQDGLRTRPCLVGSVKTNIGHLEAAAGIAAVIKVALSLHKRQIPPTLNFQTENPEVALQSLRLAVQKEISAWPEKDGPALAGIMATAMSGSNVQAVLAASPTAPAPSPWDQPTRSLPISARSADALTAQAAAMHDFLAADGAAQSSFWQDVCHTASVLRSHHPYRLAIRASSAQEAADALRAYVQEPGSSSSLQKKLLFLFDQPGVSTQSIIEDSFLLTYSAFREQVEACDRIVRQLSRRSLAELVCDGTGSGQHAAGEMLHFVQQTALAALWRSWNIVPAAMLGVGTGEVAAAYCAGMLTLVEALSILCDTAEIEPHHHTLAAPSLPCYSATCEAVPAGRDLWQWKAQLRDGSVSDHLLEQFCSGSYHFFLDLGQPSALAAQISEHCQASQRTAVLLSSFAQRVEFAATLFDTLGIFYTQGYNVCWSAVYPEERTCISLPGYQWQRERCWPNWLDSDEISTAPELRYRAEIPAAHEQEQVQLETALPVSTPPAEGDVAQQITHIWQELLGIDQIGLQDNFFTLGGSSLLVGQLLARLRRLFQVELSVTAIFEHPTIAELTGIMQQRKALAQNEPIKALEKREQQYEEQLLAIVDQLTNEEVRALIGGRETLARLLQAKISGQKIFPLSFAQRRLWFLDQLQNGSPVYNVTTVYRLTGELHIEALEKSLNAIVQRHETLRTTFAAIDGQPMQLIVPNLVMELGQEDLERTPAEQQEAEMLRLAKEEVKKSFDLAQGPLLRVRLLRLNAHEHVLFLSVHHIIFDGWSMSVFYRELATLYTAFTQGKPSPLSALPIQYIDYTAWERHWFHSKEREESLAYWQHQLAGAPPALALPTDYPRPAVESFRGAFELCFLPSNLLDALKEFSQRERVTLFMMLLTAFQVLLAHASRQEDIVIGTDVANRGQLEVEDLIGFFVNQLALRTDLSGDPSLSELLQRVRQVVLGAYEHQSIPFDQLVQKLNPVRFPNRAPVFQTKIVLQNIPVATLSSTISIDPLPIDAGAAQLDLVLDLTETASGLRVLWQYNTDLFDVSSVRQMQQRFAALLEAFVAMPERKLSSFNALLTEMEQQQRYLRNPELPQRPSARSRENTLISGSLGRAFEEQAARTPQASALVIQGREMTYAQLNAEANKLAHQLQRLGVQPETMVILCTERSLESIVGFLGILKAGGVCISLDPTYPKDRWAFILQDSQSRIVVTQQKLVDAFSAYQPLEIVDLATVSTQEEVGNPTYEVAPEQLAYVMYTSGSTGQPKGVGVSHRAALNHFIAMCGEFQLTERDRILQFYSLSFDGSLEQFFPGLFCGATIVMRGPTAWSIAELNQAVIEQKLTVVNLTPVLWQQWAQELQAEPEIMRDAQLRLIIIGAEAMTLDALRAWRKTPLAARPLINAYGPTEAVVTALTFEVPEEFFPNEESYTVPIGQPLPFRDVYVLDYAWQCVPTGTVGEIYIGGPLLARGYLNRQDLTADRFIPDPFSTVSGARLYRTGDLGRYMPDGTIECLGRVDQQVKIRGFRIELGEIETVLQQHPGVQTAVVVAREDQPGEKRLVAYVVLEQDYYTTVAEVRSFLEDRLPTYMMPSAFIRLDELPLNANGKIDRRALPAPETFRSQEMEEAFVAPRNPTEEALAKIWGEVLALEQVGIHNNFFALGGHSLIAIQVVARVRTILQVDMPVHMLFLEPTIAQFADRIARVKATDKELSLPAITRRRRG